MGIEWRPVVGVAGYSVSNTGLVRSETRTITMKNGVRRTIFQRILKVRLSGAGYPQVSLGTAKDQYVHRLVAEAFLGCPGGGMEVNHIDGKGICRSWQSRSWI